MNPQVKKIWVEALRGGKYEQTLGKLRRNEKMCCLGVLCDLHSKAFGGQWDNESYLKWEGLPPPQVAAWAFGDSKELPIITRDDIEITLDDLNDANNSFSEIADLIEAQL